MSGGRRRARFPRPPFKATATPVRGATLRQFIGDFRLACLNLGRNRARSALAVLTVTCGVAAYLLTGGFIEWSLNFGRESTIRSQLGHAQIVRPGYFERGVADPYAFLLPAGEEGVDTVRSLPGVVSVTARLAFSGLISKGDTTLSFSGEGIDPVPEKPLSERITLISGRALSSDTEPAVQLGEGLAHSLGAQVGDRVVLLVSTAQGGANAVEVEVAGLFATITKDYDDYALRLPLSLSRKLMRVQGATAWVVLLEDTAQTETFVRNARAVLPGETFEVVPWHVQADFYNKTAALFAKQVGVVKSIVAVILVLTVANLLTMSVLERTSEIGTSLAVGFTRRRIMRTFVIEGGLIGLFGGALGGLLGLVAAQALTAVGIPMPAAPGMAHGYVAGVTVTPALIVDALSLAVAATLAASAVPAWRAGRLVVVDALRQGV